MYCCPADSALQLEERRAGNDAYQQGHFSKALHHYTRALAVVNFVVGQSPQDQSEVDHNKATTLLNMAAVHMALKVRERSYARLPRLSAVARAVRF